MTETIRACRPDENDAILAIVNTAATRYRGVIPDDCWHEPYMAADQLDRDIAAGVRFWGLAGADDALLGVMGLQMVRDAALVRHAYVRPDQQGRGIGGRLLQHVEGLAPGRVLIGTWADATWAIKFYESHGYTRVPSRDTAELLRTYWAITQRQVETSVVLAKPPW